MNNKQISQQSIDDTALAYLEGKYGEKFEYAAPYGDHLSGTYEFLTTCDSLPGQTVLVQIENYKRDDKIFRDNYIAVKYRQQTIDFIEDCAVQLFGEAIVFYDVTIDGLSPELSANTSFEEYLADTRVPLYFSIRTKESLFTAEEQAEKFAEELSLYGTHFLTVLASVEDEQYGNSSDSQPNFTWRVQISRLSDSTEIDWLEKE